MHPTTPGLETLPPELLPQILAELTRADGLTLSSTSRHLRHRLAPGCFRAIRVVNHYEHETALQALEALASQTWAQSAVRTLLFVGSRNGLPPAPPNRAIDNGNEDDVSLLPSPSPPPFPSPFLPPIIRGALAGHLFRNVDTVRVTFDFDDFDDGYSDDALGPWEHASEILAADEVNSIYVHEVPETDPDGVVRAAKEARYPWRALMAETWAAVAENRRVGMTLAAPGLVPKPTSTFWSAPWAGLMGRLGSLEIGLWSGDNGAGWRSNTLDGYLHFEEHLDEYFFRHCGDGLTSLTLAAARDTAFGARGQTFDCGLPLKPTQLPGLRRLCLKNLFVSAELATFVAQHGRLERLELVDCHLNIDSDVLTSWAEFFQYMDGDGKSGALRELEVRYTPGGRKDITLPMTEWENNVFWDAESDLDQDDDDDDDDNDDGSSSNGAGEDDISEENDSEGIDENGDENDEEEDDHGNTDATPRLNLGAIYSGEDGSDGDVSNDDDDDDDGNNNNSDPERDVIVAELRALGRKAFSYAEPQSKYGDLWMVEDKNFEAFRKGEDDLAYHSLIRRLEAKKASAHT